jgi:hypothetical protein
MKLGFLIDLPGWLGLMLAQTPAGHTRKEDVDETLQRNPSDRHSKGNCECGYGELAEQFYDSIHHALLSLL